MIHYRSAGRLPQKPHSVFRDDEGKLLFEHCFTRDGFDGPFSILYHQNPPQNHGEGTPVEAPFPIATEVEGGSDEALRRRHIRSQHLKPAGSPLTGRIPLLFNADVVISVMRPERADDIYFANGDGDEVYYVHAGRGTLISQFGRLSYGPGDYVVVPSGIPHRLTLDGEGHHFLHFECKTGLHLPKQYRNPVGQLRMDAPYTHRDFRSPMLDGAIDDQDIRQVITKRRDRFTRHTYPQSPLDVVGWDGTVYPFVFPIRAFSPKIGQYHLPPTVHGTFATKGSLFCSFVPRMVDFGEGAIPCPYPHSNLQVDEILFYCDGDFTSRRGVGAGSLSLHPAGVPHGPHPGAYEASVGTTKTEELAVMLDTFEPLRVTPQARAIEDIGYDESWAR